MIVAIDLVGLRDEGRDVLHGGDLGIVMQPLTALELLERQAAAPRIPYLAQERGDGLEVVDRDVAADVDRVASQQVAQKVDLHRLLLDIVQYRFLKVLGADAVIAGVVEPALLWQLVGQGGLAYPRHAEQTYRLVPPAQELFPAHPHVAHRLQRSLPP